ncbi:MAG TPA: PAS domain S-box protein [Methanobacteriaceae archaeon]|nr:PAS domain S-box protein [Methanobacteriaceae archaeon]
MDSTVILVAVEDTLEAQKITKLLVSAKYDVINILPGNDSSFNGFSTVKPDLIIMDIILRADSKVFPAMRRLMNDNGIPLIYFSSCSKENDIKKSDMQKIYGYLVKPVDAKELLLTVKMALYKNNMENALRESEQRYRLLVENAADPIAIVDFNGEFLMANSSAGNLLGIDSESIIGKKMWDIFPEKYANQHMNSIQKVIQTKQGLTIEDKTIIQGEKRWFSANIQPTPSYNGNNTAVQLIARDITKSKQIEYDLIERRNFLSGLFNDMLAFVGVLEPDGHVIFVNNTPLELIDETLERVQGKMFSDLKWWTQSPQLKDRISRDIELCAMGETIKQEHEIYTKNGPLWIEYSMHPLYDDEGKLKYLIPEARDISSRKEIEDNFLAEKSKLKTITDNSPFGLVLIDSNGNYSYINPKFEEITGYTIEDIPNGKEWFKRAFPEKKLRNQVISAWLNDFKIAKTGEKKPRTFPVVCKNGEEKIIHFIPVRLDNGEYLMTLEDISKHLQVEQALQESEEKFRTLAQTAVDAIIITDQEGNIIFSNRSLERIFDYSAEDIMGKPVNILIPEEYKEDFAGQMDLDPASFNKWSGKVFESYGMRKDGSEFPLEMSLNIWQLDGDSYTTAIIRDITRRKLIDFKMKMREEIFQLMARNIEEVFWIIDPLNGQLLYMSPSYEKIWGLNIQKLYQNPRSWIKSIHPDDQEKFLSHIFGSLEINHLTRKKTIECRLIRPEGDIRWIRIRSFPVINENKQIYRRVGLAKDITSTRENNHSFSEEE